jgi:hypothetical protein
MQETVGIGVNLFVALDAVYVKAHAASCLYKDLCEWEWGMCLILGLIQEGEVGENPEFLWRYPWVVYHLRPKSAGPQLSWLR